jgi:hypothetical protein
VRFRQIFHLILTQIFWYSFHLFGWWQSDFRFFQTVKGLAEYQEGALIFAMLVQDFAYNKISPSTISNIEAKGFNTNKKKRLKILTMRFV